MKLHVSNLFVRPARAAIMLFVGLLVAAVGVVVPASSAQAALFVFPVSSSGPTLYQTNFRYYGPVMSAPAGTPAKAIVYVILNFSFNTSPLPAGVTIRLCNTNRCLDNLTPSAGGGSVSHYFDGDLATVQWQYSFIVNQATTHVLTPYVLGATDKVQIAYNSP
jgi:hypothetical protein